MDCDRRIMTSVCKHRCLFKNAPKELQDITFRISGTHGSDILDPC